MTNVVFRAASAVAGLAFTLLAVGFLAGWPWVEGLSLSLSGGRPELRGSAAGTAVAAVILLGPFIQRFGSVPAEHRTSLVVYTSVLVVSGLLALWYLLLDPVTRLGGRVPRTDVSGQHVA